MVTCPKALNVMAVYNITHYTLATEVWLSKRTLDDKSTLAPSEDPQREEYVTIISVNHKRTRSGLFKPTKNN